MRIFYTFTAGSRVPSWLFKADFNRMAREDLVFNSHHGSIVFGRSCVVLRGDSANHSKIMPCGNRFGDDGLIVIRGFRNAVLGGVDGATGVCIAPDGSTVAHLNAKRGLVNKAP